MSQNRKTAIIDFVRTPFTKAVTPGAGEPGQMAHVEPIDLVIPLVNALIDRNPGVNLNDVETIVLGVINQEDKQGGSLAHNIVNSHKTPLPVTVQGDMVEKLCGSSLLATATADEHIQTNRGDVFFAGGVQSLSMIPMEGLGTVIDDSVVDSNPAGFFAMGNTAENLAEKYGVSRKEQEDFAFASHQKAAAAQAAGRFDHEIVPIMGRNGKPITKDDLIRTETISENADDVKKAYDKMGTLPTAFKAGGTITAATSSGVTDGASMLLMTELDYANKHNLSVRGVVVSYAGAALAPEIMGMGPVDATRKALARAGLTMDDIDYVELNEAFAAQSLSVLKEWDNQGMHVDPAKLNIDGGAIAIGHPPGATGARMVGHITEALNRNNKHYGLATMCVGGGQGAALIVENPNFKP